MIAISVRKSENASFSARNEQFCHFLFKIGFDAADEIFKKAAQCVASKQVALDTYLKKARPCVEKSNQYRFYSSPLSWPSRLGGVNYCDHGEIIEEAWKIYCRLSR